MQKNKPTTEPKTYRYSKLIFRDADFDTEYIHQIDIPHTNGKDIDFALNCWVHLLG